MHKKITYAWLTDKCICVLLVLSMFSVVTIGISISELSQLMTADKEGYIPKDSLNILEIDVAALDEEMARTEQEA